MAFAGAASKNSREFVSKFQDFELILCRAPVSNFCVSFLSCLGDSAFLGLGNSHFSAQAPLPVSVFDNYLKVANSKINHFTCSSQLEMCCIFVITKGKETFCLIQHPLTPPPKGRRTLLIHYIIEGLRSKLNAFSFLVAILKELGRTRWSCKESSQSACVNTCVQSYTKPFYSFLLKMYLLR